MTCKDRIFWSKHQTLNTKGHRLVTSRNSGSRVKPVNSLTTSNNVEATTWKRQLGKRGGGNKNENTKIQNCDSTPSKPSNVLSDSPTTQSPPPLFIFNATTWKRQSGSDNLEATTCDPYRLPYYEWYSRECERCFYFCEEAL